MYKFNFTETNFKLKRKESQNIEIPSKYLCTKVNSSKYDFFHQRLHKILILRLRCKRKNK